MVKQVKGNGLNLSMAREKKWRFYFFLFLIIITSRLFLINPLPALFDAPEYISLSQKSFVEAITLGHKPLRSGYLAILWLNIRFFRFLGITNSALVGGFLSYAGLIGCAAFGYFLLKNYLSTIKSLQIIIIFFLLPIVSLLSTSLAAEPISFFFFISSFYFLSRYLLRPKKIYYAVTAIISLSYSLLSNLPFIFWLPVFFVLTLLNSRNSKFNSGKNILKIIGGSLLVTGVAYFGLFILASFSQPATLSSFFIQNQLMTVDWYNFPLGTIRFLRNIIITFLRDYTPIVAIVAVYTFPKIVRRISWQKSLLAGLYIMIPSLALSTFMSVDIQGRRNLPLAFVISILVGLGIKRATWFIMLVLYLLVTNGRVLYNASFFQKTSQPVALMSNLQRRLTPNGLLIHSHYLRPFVAYQGETHSLNEPGFTMGELINRIDEMLRKDKPVYIESQAIFDPYLFYGGTTLHILSLGRFGYSDANALFSRYRATLVKVEDAEKRIYVYQLFPANSIAIETRLPNSNYFVLIRGKASPGQPILIYSNRLQDRILHQRQDYYDLITWLWIFISGRHEPITWTYADASGYFEVPVPKEASSSLEVRGADSFLIVK